MFKRIFLILILLPLLAKAENFPLPEGGDSLIGDVSYSNVSGENPVSIAQRYNIGMNALIAANPGTTPTKFTQDQITVPNKYILPPLPHRGIVINLAEMRLYFYPDDGSVMTYPIGIGRVGKTIPITKTTVLRKTMNPIWYPTERERKWNKEQGIDLPSAMPPGPDNPLGPYAIYLGIPAYLIHSTIFPESIGKRASFGCIRMHEDDIRNFYPLVKSKTPVEIVYLPTKLGWENQKLFVEIHPPLEERGKITFDQVTDNVSKDLPHGNVTLVDWQALSYLADQPDGIPHEIGFKVN